MAVVEIGATNRASDVARKPSVDAGRVEHVVALWKQTEGVTVVEVGEAHGALEWSFGFFIDVVFEGGVTEDWERLEELRVDPTFKP